MILHTNDVHGRAVADEKNGVFGYASIAELKEELEEAGASVLLLDAGDAAQGMPVVNMSMGKTAMEFMNATGYDAMCPGNHEFDWGYDNLQQLRETAQFPVLAANIVDKVSGENVFEANHIFEMANGMKVGVFGLDTPEALTKTHPDKVKGISFYMEAELYACAQAQVDALTAAGCDVIVCLGHLGVSEESAPNRSYDVIENTTGIDLFIDGHSHTVIDGGETVGETLLVSTGEYFENIGMVVYDGETLSARLIGAQVDPDAVALGLIDFERDDEVEDLVNSVNAKIEKQLSTAFAKTEVVLNGERAPGVRTEETNLGDFAADAILWAARQAMGDGIVAAITNGGGIRATIQAGDITMKDMKTVFPFGNQVTVLTVTGAELLEALEAATYSTPEAIGAFPQVSGIVFTIDTTVAFEQGELYPDSTYYAPAKPGSRVTIESVGGEAFDPEALYTIATNDFTAAGGDTYYAFAYANATTGYDTGVALEDALVNYVQTELGGVVSAEMYGEPQGRITVIQ
ncbi:MAG: bifunctional UDP-sugar hydrolase/5'-nucleotidase [Eubacteriales bacterium]|nr:bifunctional UDP-sugar hydrolase/5'-nucleotidase [Eubacteriales bacterium]